MEKEQCTHPVLEPVLCRKCKSHLVAHEEEIMGILCEIAGYCNNEKCDFYKVLVV